ncbi:MULTISPECIES: hypothetical protein [unclassified Frankia]|uniref:hypothetical protein n=1 Tax=unclassified Frankia TaxID=2632575 RepID=UPI002AD4A9E1|nr:MULTISPECIES: hypothetical protein [unclassified Frankia]
MGVLRWCDGRAPAQARAGGAVVAVALFGLAACGGTGTGTPAGRSTSTLPQTTATSPAPTLHARDYVVTEGAETTGLVRDTSTDTSPDPKISESEFASCLGVPTAEIQDNSIDSADGPDLMSPDELAHVSSSADINRPGDVARDAVILRRPQAPTCIGRLFLRGLEQEASSNGESVTLDSTLALPGLSGATQAVRMAITLAANGGKIHITFDIIFIWSDRVESTIVLGQINGVPDRTREQNVISQVAAKVARQ